MLKDLNSYLKKMNKFIISENLKIKYAINLMNKLLESPFKDKDSYKKYTMPSTSDEHYVTYCGT